MIRALLKKQLMESFSGLFVGRKTGTRSKKSVAVYAALYAYVIAVFVFLFYMVSSTLCAPLVELGLTWLYIAMMGLMALTLGVIGSVFTTYSALYRAKDNDILLSMPIPPSVILPVRLSGVYIMGFGMVLAVMVPATVVYFMTVRVSLMGIIFTLLITLLISLLVLAISCILGYIVALISTHVKHKNVVTVVLSLAFLFGYFYLYSQANTLLNAVLANLGAIGEKVKTVLFPIYHMGLAAEGNALSMLIFSAIVILIFVLVYFVLSKTFLTLAISNKGNDKKVYKEKKLAQRSVHATMLFKEWKRFSSSSIYILNGGLGIIFMVVGAVAVLIKRDDIIGMFKMMFPDNDGFICLIASAAVVSMSSMVLITAPSVSLEGKNFWIVRSLPIDTRAVLKAKLDLHVLLTMPAALFMGIVLAVVISPAWYTGLLMIALTVAAVYFYALLGLYWNIKMPMLEWTSEAVPVKQGLPVLLSMMGGMCTVLVFGGIYVPLHRCLAPELYLLIVFVIILLLAVAIYRWIMKKGVMKFESL